MTIEKYNVSKPTKYQAKGEEKTKWNNVGTVTIFKKDDGSKSGKLELVSFNQVIELNIFPFKDKADTTSQPFHKEESVITVEDDIDDGEIKVENIPF